METQNKGNIRPVDFGVGQYKDLLINCQNFGRYAMLKTMSLDNNQTSPIYYIDNRTQKVVAQEKW